MCHPRVANSDRLVNAWVQARRDANRFGEFVLVLDGIRNIPDWPRIVKGLWDADRRNGVNLRVVLLDSVPMLIQKGLRESLVGRFGNTPAPYWSFREMRDAFGLDLAQYLYFGGIPGAFASLAHRITEPEFQSHWAEYVREAIVNPTLDRDALILEGVHKPAVMRDLVSLCGKYSGQIVSLNQMLRQLPEAGDTATLTQYLRALESMGHFAGLQGFTGSAFRRRSTSLKLIALNWALTTVDSGLFIRPGKVRPEVLGPHRQERGRSTPNQHRIDSRKSVLLSITQCGD